MTTMTPAERVRLSRWVNKVEETGDQLLELLRAAPNPLPRDPVFDPDLIDLLSTFTASNDVIQEEEFPNVRFLELGNGHQTSNRKKALKAAEALIEGVRAVDANTVQVDEFGVCHFAAFTHPKGAMVSSPQMEDATFGGAAWHAKSNMMMFRDAGDGRCIVYVCPIAPLFDLRTIGQHGVKWEDILRTAKRVQVIGSANAIEAAA